MVKALLEQATAGNAMVLWDIADRLGGKVPRAMVGDSQYDPVVHLGAGVPRR